MYMLTSLCVLVGSGKMLVIESSRRASVSEQRRGRGRNAGMSDGRWFAWQVMTEPNDVGIVLLARRRWKIMVSLRTEGGETTWSFIIWIVFGVAAVWSGGLGGGTRVHNLFLPEKINPIKVNLIVRGKSWGESLRKKENERLWLVHWLI